MGDDLGFCELVESSADLELQIVAEHELLDGAPLGHLQDPEPLLVDLGQGVRSLVAGEGSSDVKIIIVVLWSYPPLGSGGQTLVRRIIIETCGEPVNLRNTSSQPQGFSDRSGCFGLVSPPL